MKILIKLHKTFDEGYVKIIGASITTFRQDVWFKEKTRIKF